MNIAKAKVKVAVVNIDKYRGSEDVGLENRLLWYERVCCRDEIWQQILEKVVFRKKILSQHWHCQ